jgi:UTP--glucose-1-phosphate uridylyltransferase
MRPARAIIPLAGLGTRLYPAAKVVPKPLFPVYGPDGVVRPVVEWIVRDVAAAGIREIVLVVSPALERTLRAYFEEPPPAAPEPAGERMRRVWEETARLAPLLRYVIQEQPAGFGHAVLQTRHLAREAPFLLMLGDHLYRSGHHISCVAQVLEEGLRRDAGILGVTRCPAARIDRYGVVGVAPEPLGPRCYRATRLLEKPSPAEARRLGVRFRGAPEECYLILFGIYLLPGSVLDDLAHVARTWAGELDLSAALQRWIDREQALAYEVQGEFLDIGSPDAFRRAGEVFSRPMEACPGMG